MFDSVQPHRWQPTRLPRLWNSPGKNTRVGCHFLLQCMKVKSESEVPQSCLTLSDSMDCSFPGSSIHEIFQARVLEWVAIAFSVSAAATCKSLQFCPTLCNPIDGRPPGSAVPGILQARTGVGCHFLLQCMKVKSESEVAQSCLTFSDPMDCSLRGFSVHGISQARVLEWGAIAFSDPFLLTLGNYRSSYYLHNLHLPRYHVVGIISI